MLEQHSQIPLAALNGARYRGLAYDGCTIYLTVHGACTIIQLDDCFQKMACFNTRRAYTAICYDHGEACFWATADGCLNAIYKLNKCLEEIDCIKIQAPKGRYRQITGITYCCCDHSLVVAFADELLRVFPGCPEKQECILKTQHGCFSGVVSLCPYLLCNCLEGAEASICIYSPSGELLQKVPAPFGAGMEAAIFWPCANDDCRCHLLLLHTKQGCYPHLCDYTLTCDAVCDDLCRCNYDICQACHCPDCREDACTDLLESIALMEAALSHILNAEGEKLQKVIASTDDICKILAVNESVNTTLSKVIFLEQLLCCKLESLECYCDICAQPEPCE